MGSILVDIKKLLGLAPDYTHFDVDIIININAAIMELHQIGIGLTEEFVITSDIETWEDLLGTSKQFESVKMFIYFTVRMGFDPPQHAYLLNSIENQRKEISWRLMIQSANQEV